MADDTQKLTQEERDRIVQWIKKAMGDTKLPCPVCKSDDWLVAEHLVSTPIVSPQGGVTIGGPTYPHSPIICQICGFTYFINSVRMGISTLPQDDESAAKTAEKREAEPEKQEEENG